MSLAAAICLLIPGIPKTSAKDNFTFAPGLDIFTNLEDLLNFFRSDASLLARQILKVFKRDCLYVNNAAFKDSSEKPFIVIVGNHRATREAVGITVAQMLGGKYMTYPAPCLQRFISQMPKGTMLRRAFYFLSNYASAFYVKIQLSLNNPVVLNGTVNLYRLMQSRHPIVIQDASRFLRDTAFSIYNYIFDQRLFAGQ
ncbi:uncharacterized protein LOC124369979 isoform X5 [Homalodisca vitripennis]|uniref:uncharacterized protein LOC124369979 isoform X5 n=1 Tax=Homalodisca vitripennis TaxID=197043 RepID=UPI001EEAC705|nr:uncharacterized protein LOC124369979 isoform X5 [Homalodisca vitripennis]